jgi:hypothetical protein
LEMVNSRAGLRADFIQTLIDFDEPGACADFTFLGIGGCGAERRGRVYCSHIKALE